MTPTDSPRTRRRSLLRAAALGYVALLHVVIGVLVARTDFLRRAGVRLGLLPRAERTAELSISVVEQARQDQGAAGGALVLLGDSIATQLDAARIAGDAVNYGIGGDTTRTLLWRLPLLRSVESARTVVVIVGVNDLGLRPVPAIAADYRALLAAFPPAAVLVVVSPLPVDEAFVSAYGRPGLGNAALRSINAALRPLCEARPGCRFLDAWPAFWDGAAGNMQRSLHRGDGLHLSPAGSRALEDLIRAAVGADPGQDAPPGRQER